MTMAFRFFAYNPSFFTTQYLILEDNGNCEVMSSARYIDRLFEMMDVVDDRMIERTPGLLPRPENTLHINMDRLHRTNPQLFYKTYRILTHFDDRDITPVIVEEWALELNDWLKAQEAIV